MSRISSLGAGKVTITLLVGGVIILGSIVETTWATPAQHPQRQSIPALTPTPAASPLPPDKSSGSPPPVETAPSPPPTPLSPTPVPPSPTVAPEAVGEETPQPAATERGKTETATPLIASTPAPSSTPRSTEAPATPLAPVASASAFGAQAVVNLTVMGLGLILLVLGLILTQRRRA